MAMYTCRGKNRWTPLLMIHKKGVITAHWCSDKARVCSDAVFLVRS